MRIMPSSTSDRSRRRVGRPRARPAQNELPPDQAILDAARKLFRSRGFAATSTRQIAEAAGLRQPSLFHHFSSKTAILQAIVDLAVAPELAFIDSESRRGLEPDVALYRYARFVYTNLATNPNVIGSPLQFPETDAGDFKAFWRAYERIYSTLKSHIAAGVAAGLFDPVDVDVAAEQTFALLEAPLGRPQRSARRATPAARQAAVLVLKGLLKEPRRLPGIQAAADAD